MGGIIAELLIFCQYEVGCKRGNSLATSWLLFYPYLIAYLGIKQGMGTAPLHCYLQISTAADES